MAYSALTTAQVDQDSPINTTLMGQIRTNQLAFKDGTAFSGVIGTTAMNFANASGSIAISTTPASVNLGTSYGHYPVLTWNRVSGTRASIDYGLDATGATTVNGYYIISKGDGTTPSPTTATYGSEYHAACPPYSPFKAAGRCAGEWGLFVLVLRDRSTGEIFASMSAPDPHWRDPFTMFDKNDPELIAKADHQPLQAFSARRSDGQPADLETVMVCLREWDMEPVNFCRMLMLAEHKEAEAEKASGEARDALLAEAEKARKLSAPVRMKQRDALYYQAKALGVQPWDLLVAKAGHLLSATEQAKSNGRPIVSGVESFDRNITIVAP